MGQKEQKEQQGTREPGRAAGEKDAGIMALTTVLLSLTTLAFTNLHLSRASNRHAVYWNSSNILWVLVIISYFIIFFYQLVLFFVSAHLRWGVSFLPGTHCLLQRVSIVYTRPANNNINNSNCYFYYIKKYRKWDAKRPKQKTWQSLISVSNCFVHITSGEKSLLRK